MAQPGNTERGPEPRGPTPRVPTPPAPPPPPAPGDGWPIERRAQRPRSGRRTEDNRRWPGRFTRGTLSFAAFAAALWGVRALSEVLQPLVLGLTLAFASLPLLELLTRWRVPRVLGVMIVILVDLALLVGVGVIISDGIAGLSQHWEVYQARLVGLEHSLREALERWQISVGEGELLSPLEPQRVWSAISTFMTGTARLAGDVTMGALIVAFLLAEAASWSRRLNLLVSRKPRAAAAMRRAWREMSRYFGMKTLSCVLTGFAAYAVCWYFSVPEPVLWGLIAGLLQYVPFVGSLIASIPPIVLTLLDQGFPGAAWVTLGYLALNIGIGNVLEPLMFGRTASLSPLVVLVSVLLGGWALGPIGALVSVPFLTTVRLFCEEMPELRWLAVLLAYRPPEEAWKANSDLSDG